MKKILLALCLITGIGATAQNWQSETDKMWGNYCYREKDGTWMDAVTNNGTMSVMPSSNNIRLAYYWRIPKGKVRADIAWTNKYLRLAKLNVVVTYPATGDTLAKNTISNNDISSKERINDLFGTINFPEDDFYRVEISSPEWSYVRNIKNFTFQRESTDPVMIPRNFGGTSAHMFSFGTTDPSAPYGSAYDWGYVECMVPPQYSYTATYYMTMGPANSYMGMQNSGPNGNDVNKSVLFSVWDNGNMDKDPNLPLYLQSRVMDGNQEGVHTHAGGEGSSASVMLKDRTTWWRPGHWVQFLLNMRPELVKVNSGDQNNPDATFDYSNVIMSVWYKCDTMPSWRYLATIRSSGQTNLLSGWYCFIEPFTSYHGQMMHRVFYRNAMMRSASSGLWYSRNNVYLTTDHYDRDFHYDFGRGASQEYPGAFFLDMGAYVHQHDSANVIPLVTDKTCVDTINTDRLLNRVEQAIMRDSRLDKNWLINLTADAIPGSTWQIDTKNSSPQSSADLKNLIDDRYNTKWSASDGMPYSVALTASTPQTVSSATILWEDKYSSRMRYADIYTSEDGANWKMAFDSLEIRCEDSTQISFPAPVTTEHLKMVFYKGWDQTRLSINTLRLRGAYNLERAKALAKKYIDNANEYTYFSSEALQPVIAAYQDGNTTDADGLVAAMRKMVNTNMPLNYSKLTSSSQVVKGRAYTLKNVSGHGLLAATKDNKLTTLGATITGAQTANAAAANITDPYQNWLIIRSELYDNVYLYNVGARKFVNTAAEGQLSDEPEALNLRGGSGSFYFRGTKGYVGVDATNNSYPLASLVQDYCQFAPYDNYVMRQSDSLATQLFAKVEDQNKLSLYKKGINEMLNAPVGVVGGFTSEQAKQELQSAYDNADNDPEAFIKAVENVDVIAFDPENEVYRISSTTDKLADKPFLSSTTTETLATLAQSNEMDQIWRFQKRNYGYTMHSQGHVIKPIISSINAIPTSSDPAQSGTFVLDEVTMGKYAIGPAQACSYMINGATSPMRTSYRTNDGSQWYLMPTTSYSVTLNGAGVRSGYFDFAVRLPEGLNAYVANHVTGDGVIKLTHLNGIIPPNTPVLLRGEKYQSYVLDILNTPEALDSANIFRGTYLRTNSLPKGTFYTLSSSNGQPVMKKPALAVISANNIYLPYEDGMPQLDTYTFDFDDLVDAVNTAVIPQQQDCANSPAYTIDGRRAFTTQKGNIYIQGRRKVLK